MKRTSLFLFAALLLGACGGDKTTTGPDNGGNGDGGTGNGGSAGGTYSATVSGDMTGTISGNQAIWASGKDTEGNEAFVIVGGFENQTTSIGIAFVRPNQTRPGNGTYQIGEATGADTANVFQAIGIMNQGKVLLSAESGTLTITSSSDSKVAGSFQFDGSAVSTDDPSAEKAVHVTGTFSAVHSTTVPTNLSVTSLSVHAR